MGDKNFWVEHDCINKKSGEQCRVAFYPLWRPMWYSRVKSSLLVPNMSANISKNTLFPEMMCNDWSASFSYIRFSKLPQSSTSCSLIHSEHILWAGQQLWNLHPWPLMIGLLFHYSVRIRRYTKRRPLAHGVMCSQTSSHTGRPSW